MSTRPTSGWTKLGLIIALLGIPAIVTAQHLLLPDLTPAMKAAREVLILALSAFLLWIIVKGERLPLSSVGCGGFIRRSARVPGRLQRARNPLW